MNNLSENLESSSEEESHAPVWPAELEANANLPFRPTEALVTTQNPPDFSWPFVPGADLYRLELSQVAIMDQNACEKSVETTNNYYNFPFTLKNGIWYWRVRYHNVAGGWSEWSPVRKFRISELSIPFPVPPIDEMLARMEVRHPRVWTNPDELAAFRERRQFGISKLIFEKTLASVLVSLDEPLPENPDFPYMDGNISTVSPAYVKALQDLRKYTDSALDRLLESSFIYLLTGDRNIGGIAKNLLIKFTSWDPDGASRFDINDQVHRAVAYRSSIAYDWVYDLLSAAERQAVQDMVHTRVSTLIDHYLVRQPIYQFPFDSHGWTIAGYIGLIGTIMLNDIPDAEDWVRRSIPAFINLLPPWGGEDGSWSQGTGYWQWSSGSNKELMDVLRSAGAINLYDKAFSRNEGLYPLYMFPHGSPSGVFGNDSHYKPDLPSISLLNRLAQIYGDPRLKWASEAIGEEPSLGLHDYIYGDHRLGQLPPCDLPKSKWFPTTGLVAMHDDLTDPERISLYFRSSPYGSYSHSIADQNGFILHAYGESLAIKSGFYDYYNSVHHKGFTKRTISANAITIDGGQGQRMNDFDAKGRIVGFASHPAFNATTGDAVGAYGGELSRALRHIVYVKPSVFVVIDDLATSKPDGASFEWNLHADECLMLDADGGATIEKGKAGLKVRHYGREARSYQNSVVTHFHDSDGVEVPPVAGFSGMTQVHATFATPKTDAAILVATLSPYRLGNSPQEISSEEYEGFIRMSFTDGTMVFVRTAPEGLVNTGVFGFRFEGAALAVRGGSLLLVHGTMVERDGIIAAQSNVPSTIAWGEGCLSMSVEGDAKLSFHTSSSIRLRDESTGHELPESGDIATRFNSHGLHWTAASDRLHLKLEKGYRAFKLDESPMPEPLQPVILPTEINGVIGQMVLEAWRDIDGHRVSWGNLEIEPGHYKILEAPDGLTFTRRGRIHGEGLVHREPIIIRGELTLLRLVKKEM